MGGDGYDASVAMTASSPAYMRVLPSGMIVWPSRLSITTINGMLALRHVAQALTGQTAVGRYGDLAQRNLGTLFKRRRGHNQQVAFLDHGIAVG